MSGTSNNISTVTEDLCIASETMFVEAKDECVCVKTRSSHNIEKALSWLCLAIRKPMPGAIPLSRGFMKDETHQEFGLDHLSGFPL